MKDRAEELLAGPRGRRLCVELVKMLCPQVRRLVALLAYELDPGKGVSRVWLGPRGEAAAGDHDVVSVDQLATVLTGMDLSGITDKHIHAALAEAVDTAMYWQEPDGDDVLASHLSIHTALGRVAERVLGSSLAQQWVPPRQEVQWVIDWETTGDPAPLPRDPQGALAAWAQNERAAEGRTVTGRSDDPKVSFSGTWWSTPHGVIESVGQIPAGLDFIEDRFGWKVATVTPVRGFGTTYEIHTPEDWVRLCRDYPLEVTASRGPDWHRVTGRHGRWVIPDWEQVAAQWDAVHLTVLGYLSTATRALPVQADTATVLAGWNPDTTIWLTDTVREWDAPRQEWHRPYGDAWTLA